MGATLAFLVCSVGVAGLFILDRDSSTRNSKALWLPVIWLWLVGSRPVSAWFGIGTSSVGSLDATLDGSPTDAAIYLALLVAGLAVLIYRKKKTRAFLAANGLIIIYFSYCLLSVTWSPFHGPAFKRWAKAVGDLVMVLIIVTDGQPIAALRRLYSRVGFILLPFSIELIRYTGMGRGFGADGSFQNTGVTTNKNTLGLIVFLISLGALWNVRELLINKAKPHRGRRLVAQFTLLAFGVALLQMAHSATAVGCFLLGGGLMLATGMRAIRSRPGRIRALSFVVVLAGALTMLLGGQSVISNALGRGSGLSGRTDIWAAAIASAGNPVIGTGFESFWNANAHKVNDFLHLRGFVDQSNLVSAHNGYLEVYLDLGLIGVCLIVLILISGFRHASKAFKYNPSLGSLMLAYVTTATFYSITEAGFRMLSGSWIFLLLAVVSTSGAAAGLFARETPDLRGSRAGTASGTLASDNLVPERETVHTSRHGSRQFEITRANNLR